MRGSGGPARGLPHPAADFVQLALKLELVGGEAVANGVIALDFHARIIGPTVRIPHLSGDRLELSGDRLEFHHWLISRSTNFRRKGKATPSMTRFRNCKKAVRHCPRLSCGTNRAVEMDFGIGRVRY